MEQLISLLNFLTFSSMFYGQQTYATNNNIIINHDNKTVQNMYDDDINQEGMSKKGTKIAKTRCVRA